MTYKIKYNKHCGLKLYFYTVKGLMLLIFQFNCVSPNLFSNHYSCYQLYELLLN